MNGFRPGDRMLVQWQGRGWLPGTFESYGSPDPDEAFERCRVKMDNGFACHGSGFHPDCVRRPRDLCFHQEGKLGAIDVCILDGGTLRSQIQRETLEEIRLRYPGAEVGDLDTLARKYEEAMRSPPTEITRARFHEMLEVLPPMKWHQRAEFESFMVSELVYASIANIYVRVKGRYFTLADHLTLTPEEIEAAVLKAFPDVLEQENFHV